jgi:hypothetical protein
MLRILADVAREFREPAEQTVDPDAAPGAAAAVSLES